MKQLIQFFMFWMCSYINERNRQRNVERAEEALKVGWLVGWWRERDGHLIACLQEEMANIKDKEEDPFTRRKCMPRLVTFVSYVQYILAHCLTHL